MKLIIMNKSHVLKMIIIVNYNNNNYNKYNNNNKIFFTIKIINMIQQAKHYLVVMQIKVKELHIIV